MNLFGWLSRLGGNRPSKPLTSKEKRKREIKRKIQSESRRKNRPR